MSKKNLSNQIYSSRLIHHLARLEGQIRGIRKMLDQNKACIDVVRQLLAVRESVSSLCLKILEQELACRQTLSKKDKEYLKTLFKIK